MSLFINDWKNWCRTCGKNNFSDCLDFLKWNTLDENQLEDIKRLFQNLTITIPADDNLICIDCYSYLKQFVAFTKQSRKMNDMFAEIHFDYESFGDCDLLAIRTRYDLPNDMELSTKSSDIHKITDNLSDGMQIKIEVFEFHDSQLDRNHMDQKKYEDSIDNELNENFLDGQDKLVNNYAKNTDDYTSVHDKKLLNKIKNKKRNLKKHLDRKPPKIYPFNCDKCSKVCISAQGLSQHLKIHSKGLSSNRCLIDDEKLPDKIKKIYPFNCDKCSKGCLSAQGFSQHLKMHSTGNSPKDPIVCEQCGKSCVSLHNLIQHQALVHNNEYRFECSKCLKKFKTKFCLRRHEKSHGSKSNVCDICDQRFITKASIRVHMIVHSELKKYKCNYCGHEFKRRRALQAHLITHFGMKPYKCPFCDKSFTYGTSCRLHKKTVHPQKLAELEASGEAQPFTNLPKLEYLQPIKGNRKTNRQDYNAINIK